MSDDLRERIQVTLGDAYTLEQELGGGGMSRVFLARDERLGRRVVVKVLSPELAAGVSIERFERETLLAATLQHPCIVPILAAADAAGLPYYTMPFVEGRSLRTRLETEGALPVADTIRILRDVASALAYAHERGIVHRDVKPDNILLSGGYAVVTDFGIAKALSAARTQAPGGTLTVIGTSIGTPAYMAPEQAAADPSLDHRADLYSLGVVAYELLAGTPPFHGLPHHRLIAAHLATPPEPVAAKRPDVPPALAALVMRLLEKDPADRPRDAVEVVAALDAARMDAGVASTPRTPSAAERPAAPARSRPRGRRIALASLAVALVAVAAAGFWLAGRGEGAGDATATPSIAVLPFAIVGGDTAEAYFADGMADELTTALSKLPGLRVASRRAAAAWRGSTAPADSIARALEVTTLLSGSVRREGERRRVTAELTDANGDVLWSDVYQHETRDVFAVQDEITRAIVGRLRMRLAGGAAVGEQGTDDAVAYDLYLRGRHLVALRGADNLRRAIDYFERALATDPEFARAWAGLADAIGLLPWYGDTPIDSAAAPARRAAERAIALDSTLAEAYTALGNVLPYTRDWTRMEWAFRRAIALDPRNQMAHHWLGEQLLVQGRVSEGLAALDASLLLDPLTPVSHSSRAYALVLAGRPAHAIAAAERALELDPALLPGFWTLARAQLATGRPDDAAAALARTPARIPVFEAFESYMRARAGDPALARTLRAELERSRASGRAARGHVNGALAVTALALGDTAAALDALERAVAAHDFLLASVSLLDPVFDPLRRSPRFTALARALRLDPAKVGA